MTFEKMKCEINCLNIYLLKRCICEKNIFWNEKE
jgi:hypothetical protein